jgi:glutamine amidotransferase
MNCASESHFALAWPDFCERGGATDIHADGWGLAFYEQGQGLRQFHDVQSAATSPLARFLGQQPIKTRNLLAHIRYATTGTVELANVHPFTRE